MMPFPLWIIPPQEPVPGSVPRIHLKQRFDLFAKPKSGLMNRGLAVTGAIHTFVPSLTSAAQGARMRGLR